DAVHGTASLQALDVLMRVAPYIAFAVAAALAVGYLGAPGLVVVGLFLLAGLASAAILLRRPR
ncbi:MAG TPA: hypothetical protein VKE23_04090, partial [Candidatus Limnocylindria bacterium]|nr:hypothetical protein [Candidatus Limnocylindria bacterium]